MDILLKITEIITDYIDDDAIEVEPTKKLENMTLDSLDTLYLEIEIESEFGINFEENKEGILPSDTINSIVKKVKEKLSQK